MGEVKWPENEATKRPVPLDKQNEAWQSGVLFGKQPGSPLRGHAPGWSRHEFDGSLSSSSNQIVGLIPV